MDYGNGWNTERQWAEVKEYLERQYGAGNEFDKGGVVTVTEMGHEIAAIELPRPLAAFSKRATDAGWTVRNVHSRTYHSDILYADNSKVEGGAEKGQVRTPAHFENHYSVYAWSELRAPVPRKSFRIHYDMVNGKSKFLHAQLSGRFFNKVGEFDTELSKYISKKEKK